ncbi:6187_t:CDS:2, partial [Gigaspora rosea]
SSDQIHETDTTLKKYSYKKVEKAEIRISKRNIRPTLDFGLILWWYVDNKNFIAEKPNERTNMYDINAQTSVGTTSNIINSTNAVNFQLESINRSLNSNSDANGQIISENMAAYFGEDELTNWIDSLKDPQLWDIIKYDDIHSIFDLSKGDLQKEI